MTDSVLSLPTFLCSRFCLNVLYNTFVFIIDVETISLLTSCEVFLDEFLIRGLGILTPYFHLER